MLRRSLSALLLLLCLAGASGCGGKADVKQDVPELEKALAPLLATSATDPGQASIQKCASGVVAALKAGNYPAAMDQFTVLQRQRGLTPEQRMVINNASSTLVQELTARAEKGDAEAKAALARRKQELDQR